MVENFNKIKEYVIILGGFEDTPKLDVQIQMIINEALAYCYREDVPQIMELPLADVIASRINANEVIGIDGNVASYSEGDMSVSFNTSVSSSDKAFYDGKLEPFKKIIGIVKDV